MNARHLFLLLIVALVANTIGCMGGSFINGALVVPPPLPLDEAKQAVAHIGVSEVEQTLISPIGVRVYPTGEVIVDVVVMFKRNHNGAGFANYYTNGFNVPTHFHSEGRAQSFIVFEKSDGTRIGATRAILGTPPFEGNRPELHACRYDTDGLLEITVSSGARQHQAYVVPILLSTNAPLDVGEAVAVRIYPPRGRSDDTIDNRWYQFTVKAVELPASESTPQ